MKNIKVSAAVIIKEKKIFIAQRGYGEFKGFYEFPGGKVEPNEKSSDTVIREIKEELDTSIKVDSFLTTIEYDYPSFHLSMDVYLTHLINPHLELLEHEDGEWVYLSETKNYNLLPPDKLIIEALIKSKVKAV